MDSIFRDVVTEAKNLVGAQSTRLFLVVDTPSATTPSSHSQSKENQYLYGRYANGKASTSPLRWAAGRSSLRIAWITGQDRTKLSAALVSEGRSSLIHIGKDVEELGERHDLK